MNRRFISVICLLLWIMPLRGQQQFDCSQVMTTLNLFEQRASTLRTDNPDLVRLHYLFAKDLERELKNYFDTLINNVHQCPDLVYYDVVRRYDEVSFTVRLKTDSLYLLKNQTDTLFIEEAKKLLPSGKWEEAIVWLEKALQHNPNNAEAKVLRCEIYLKTPQYARCVELVHDIYNHAALDYELEKRVSDITAALYKRLYDTGDSLIKNDQAADALLIFTVLEEFCHNMPSNYCNDDYYRGILRSKSGVYESYIIIARVALERKNYESAALFLEYAEQYRVENLKFINLSDQTQNEATIATIKNAIEAHHNRHKTPVHTAFNEVADSEEMGNDIAFNPDETVEAEEPETAPQQNPLTPADYEATDKEPIATDHEPIAANKGAMATDHEAMVAEYRRLVIDAAYYFAISDYEQARSAAVRARELEACNCFPLDARVALIYNSLIR